MQAFLRPKISAPAINFLLEKGADPNCTLGDKNIITVLFERKMLDWVAPLINAGFNVRMLDYAQMMLIQEYMPQRHRPQTGKRT